MKRFFTKLIAYALVFSMTFLFAQPQVYADELEKTEVSAVESIEEFKEVLPHRAIDEKMERMELSAFTEKLSTDKELSIVGEDTSLRTPATKYLVVKDKDGKESYVEMTYSSAVHYIDNGAMKDIDNTLKVTRRTNGKEYFETTSNIIKTAFTKRTGYDSLFEVAYEDITMKWTLLDVDGAEAEISDSSTLRTSKIADNVKNISSVKYKNIKPDTDINYTVKGVSVKEDIIVHSAQDNYEYQFVLEIHGATPKMQDNGEIIIHTKSRGPVFVIASPYMYDANGRESTAVSYTLEQLDEYNWLITVVADEEWINSEETVFPVCIDPTIEYSKPSQYSSCLDNICYHSSYNGEEQQTYYMWSAQVGTVGTTQTYWLTMDLNYLESSYLDAYDKLTGVYIGFFYQSSIETQLIMKTNDGTLVDVIPVSTTESGEYGYLYFDATKLLKEAVESGQAYETELIIEKPSTEADGYVTLVINNECDHFYCEEWVHELIPEYPELLEYCYFNDYAAYPAIIVDYNQDIGLAGQYTYNQSTVGTSGTLFVNHYTGKPTFIYNDGSMYGNIMPLSMYHVLDRENWSFSLHQTCYSDAYFNELGARIEFIEKDGKIIDASGLGITATVQNNNIILTDKQQTEYTFVLGKGSYSARKLSQIKDTNNNTVTIADDKITDASGEIYTIEYTNKLMSRLTYPDGQSVVYTYDTQKRISTVTNCGNTTTFTYDDEGRLSSVTDGLSQTKIVITYDATDKVSQITEQTADGTTSGQSVKFAYNFDYRTDYTTSGKDDIIDTADDVTVSVQFDRWGRTTGTYYEADGKLLSTSTDYNSADETSTYSELRKNNKQTVSTIFSNASANLIPNGSAETEYHWFSFVVNEDTMYLDNPPYIDTSESKYGDSSIAIGSPLDEDFIYTTFQEVNLTPGTYTFSAYVKTENVEGSGGAFIGVFNYLNPTDVNGTLSSLQKTEYMKGTTAEIADDGWRRITYTFTVSNTTTLYIGCGIKDATGTAYFDCFQLEKGEYASEYNLVENGGFEYNDLSWDIPDDERTWVAFNSTVIEYDGDNCLATIPTETEDVLLLYDTIPVNKSGISSIYASCWVKIDSTPTMFLQHMYDTFKVVVYYTDGEEVSESVKANSLDTDWQYLSFMVLTDPEKTISSIFIDFWHLTYPNPAYLDDVSIIVADGTKLEYDNEGNIKSSDPAETDKTTMEYDALNRLTRLTDSLGKTYTYTYDDNGNITHAESSIGTYIDATYDNRGLATSSVTSGSTTTENGIIGTDKKFYSSATYTEIGGYTSSVTDSTGLSANYNYNTTNGLLNSTNTSDNPNVKTRYSYTTLKQLAQTYIDQNNNNTLDSSESSVNYQYNNKAQLQSITANGMTYTFSYDVFGNMTSVGISGRTPLATYNYGTNNGKLQSVTYANGTTLTYEYDDLERLIKVKNGNTVVEEYTYDLFGNVTKLTDGNWTQNYIYDDFNRVLESHSSGNGKLRTQYGYDAQSRLSAVLYEFTYNDLSAPLNLYEYEYGLNEAVSKVKHNSQSLLEYTFDSLGRRQSILYSKLTQNNSAYTATFSYKDSTVGANATTPLVSTIAYPDHSYGYTYKANGDIEAVTYTYGTSTYTSFYHYDDLRRLVREDNGYSYRTYTYEYDASGNILNRKEYSYTAPTAQVGTATSTDTYTYGDSTWKDLLTSYNGESMVYDAVGNPTTYRGKAFTWNNATRMPLTMQTDAGSLEFSYDATGARREKTATFIGADVSHFYHYDGGILLYEVISTQTPLDETPTVEIIEYLYDETGSPVGMIYDETEYYFVKNLQGDIQRIYTASGTLVGEYHYDAWGNILNESSLSAIAQINPFRYRSYYYDSETGLYYLNSRYYDAETGRFISGDSVVEGVSGSVNGYNLFAYCFNNPVNMIDEDGYWPRWATIALGVVAAAAAIAVTVATFGAAAPAAVCTLTTMGMYLGASYTVATTVAAVAVSAVGTAAVAYAGDLAYASVTGESPLLENVFQGNEDAYNAGLMATTVGMGVVGELAAQSPGVCFIEGTLVLTSNGHIPIEKIQVGDTVWSENPETGEKDLKEVARTFVNETTELVHIFMSGEEIVTTPEHPFYVPNLGWTKAINLRAGDMLVMQNGKYIVAEKIQHEILENPVTVYNFEVEDFNTYYVGSTEILVHNMCAKKSDIKQIEDVSKKMKMTSLQRREFGDYVESLKSGIRNDINFSFKELMQIAKEFLGNDKHIV